MMNYYFILGSFYRGRCEILPCRIGPGFGSSASIRNCVQRPETREVKLYYRFVSMLSILLFKVFSYIDVLYVFVCVTAFICMLWRVCGGKRTTWGITLLSFYNVGARYQFVNLGGNCLSLLSLPVSPPFIHIYLHF